MKKQILILAFLSLAFVFAGVNKAVGQLSPTPYIEYLELPTGGTLTCAPEATLTSCGDTDPSPINPLVGKTYDYEVTVNPSLTSTGSGGIHWYVIDITANPDLDLFKANNSQVSTNIDPGDGLGDYIMTATAQYGKLVTADPNNIDNTVTLSWKSFDGTANVVLLVAYVLGEDGCTDNIEVYRIQPQFSFALEIAAINATGETIIGTPTDPAEDCVSPIESATYDATNDILNVDYGENWLFFAVNASNFVDSWMPQFQLSYSGTVDEALELEWAYPANATTNSGWNPLTYDATDDFWSSNVAVGVGGAAGIGTGNAAADGGECIYVRVRVDHGTAENAFDNPQTVTLAVNGIMYDDAADNYTNSALEDIHDDGSNCLADSFDNDVLDYVLTPRPDVNSSTETSPTDATIIPFEDKNTTP